MNGVKKKVLLIDAGGWGGIAHYTYNLANSLSLAGDVETVVLTDRNYELEELPRSFVLIKKPLQGVPYMSAVRAIFKAISEVRPDIIHIQALLAARRDWIFFLPAGVTAKKIVLTCHNVMPHEEEERGAFFMKGAMSFIYGSVDKIIAHSNYSRQRLIDIFRLPPKKIEVIPHGNYLFLRTKEIAPPEAKRLLGISSQKKVVLCFGSIRRYKGIDTLLRAFKDLLKAHKEAVLLVVGKPINTSAGYYARLADSLGLVDHVLFREGYVKIEEVGLYFFASDLVVLPYKEVDTSGSLQAAYAFSKPVILTRSGGAAEDLRDGVNGALVPPDDSQGLGAAMDRLLSNDDLRKKMGGASLVLAKEEFSWDKIAALTSRLYSEVAK